MLYYYQEVFIVREIKFRVKIKGDAGIYKVWQIDWLNQKVYAYRACGYEWVPFNKIQSLMQWTGLRDCKRTEEYPEGQDIYESDIVKGNITSYGENDIGIIKFGSHEVDNSGCEYSAISCVGWFIKLVDCASYYSYNGHFNTNRFEVIGNIYQNKELLTCETEVN